MPVLHKWTSRNASLPGDYIPESEIKEWSGILIDKETLKRWCTPPTKADPYLRPFVVRGPLSTGGAAIVGVNPATPIFEDDGIAIEDYAQSILNLDQFLPLYQDVRRRSGKTRLSSPTRTGLDGASSWLASLGHTTVLDTNTSPYPTSSEKEWRRLPESHKALHVFREVLELFRPSLILLHGKPSYEAFIGEFAPHLRRTGNFTSVVRDHANLGIVPWEFGGYADVYVCSHLRFFGKEGLGKRFHPLRKAVLASRR
ncbi:hypothetical protein ABE485_13560 [Achromobacter spanius]|uniref:hypothetical protein n=1 Tax=Achromobacter spanius TaxID=217203 RepID=UPI003208188B